jgi:predicted acylesterase/phospholipase RssA
MLPASPQQTAASSKKVHEDERRLHLRKPDGEPLVGLALSGGGIRSATFGLGVLQAMKRLGLFSSLDYVSTVSGGGYIGGWLQAVIANGPPDPELKLRALDLGEAESREVRFLRGFSNYLTPKLGLFSGDTWAAVGVSIRNLILNFAILSLSLAAPLILPWVVAILFWSVASWHVSWGIVSCLIVVIVSAALLSLPTFTGTLNMARPVDDRKWTKSGTSKLKASTVYASSVIPSLLAVGLASGVTWAQAAGVSTAVTDWVFVLAGAVAYGAAWAMGLLGGFIYGNPARQAAATTQDPPLDAENGQAVGRALWAGAVLVVTALIAGLIGTAVWLYGSRALLAFIGGADLRWRVSLLVFPLGVASLFLCVTTHLGLAGRKMSEETREWWGRVGGVQLLLALLLTVVGVIALAGPHLPGYVSSLSPWFAEHEATVAAVVGGLWASLTGAGVAVGRSERTRTGDGPALHEWIGRIAPVAFVIGYLLILSGIIYKAVRLEALQELSDLESALQTFAVATAAQVAPLDTSWIDLAVLTGLCVGTATVALAVSWLVDLNEFSLHMLYRNRLVRCYLGASRKREPNPFTGFDSDDDLPLSAEAGANGRAIRPYPIYNVALNLVGGQNLAWQQRKATSFIFTPAYCGFEYRTDEQEDTMAGGPPNMLYAYAPTAAHAGDDRSLTMGLAVATSGAAASPNMGYHSSPTLTFLMTVFNVRLGWWLRNPRWPKVWARPSGGLSLRELLYELLGMTTDRREWVYLSDGGHFENLGIYELVRRRCRFIIACDAGQDGAVTFGDLGNAIEKCRADFGVDIEIDVSKIRPAPGRAMSEWHCAVGSIRYDRQKREDVAGTLLYIKSSLTGNEPTDVLRYAAEHPAFPHESTNDQFFDESQFESYRALGYHIAHEVFGPALAKGAAETAAETMAGRPLAVQDLDVLDLFTRLGQVWAKPAPSPPNALHRYSGALTRIWSTMRSSNDLRFLDEQMFPEMPSLIGLPFDLSPESALSPARLSGRLPVNYWLPPSAEERRAGFYICNEMLQLMEDVFLEFDLDQYHDHIDNRGWMNLFQHWAWSGMLGATWAMTGSMFDPRFQRFCRSHLALYPGTPSVATASPVLLPSGGVWRGMDAAGIEAAKSEWQQEAGLNFWEAELVGKFLRATRHESLSLYPVIVTVESPRRSDGNPLQFNVGYLIGDLLRTDGGSRFFLNYMRIQNHLRKMGLARDSLKALQHAELADIEVVQPNFDPSVADGRLSDEGLPLPEAVRYIEQLVRSIPKARS